MSTKFRSCSNGGKETIYLIDGSAYVYRAYYAVKGLSNSAGQPTNAVFGFVRMLIKLLNERLPKYLAMFFDVKGPTFRHDQYKEYKANRTSMPRELVEQLPLIKKAVEGFGVSIFERTGFEADDLIGTVARIVVEQFGLNVVIVTGDKDMMQLVNDYCTIWDPIKNVTIDSNSIRTKFGIEPKQIIDIMGFSGDRSDNIPGVPGVGPKTALSLVKQFGNMKKCYENITTITKKKQKETLLKFREQAFLSRRLATIDVHVPIKVEVENLLLPKPNKQCLSSLFRTLEFKQLEKEFTEKPSQGKKKYVIVDSMKLLNKLAFNLNQCSRFALNTETDSLNPMMAKLVGVSVSMKINEAFYIPIAHDYPGVLLQLPLQSVLDILGPILSNPDVEKIGQNIRYDSIVFLRHGVVVRGVVFDTMLASYLIDPSKKIHGLDQIAMDFLDTKNIGYEEVVGKGKNRVSFDQVSVEKAAKYSCEDVDIILKARNVFIPILEKAGLMDLMVKVEVPLIPVLLRMEMKGICVDKKALKQLSFSLENKLILLEKEIYLVAGEFFNINSAYQLGRIMFEKLKLPFKKRTKSRKYYSTDVKVLTKLKVYHKLPGLVLEYRKLFKLKSTYVDSLLCLINPYTYRVHTSFNQTTTATGRLSSSNPNVQNIPVRTTIGREIRKTFIPAENCYFLSADYSQIELRILAHYSEDPILIDSFQKDEDIHVITASEIFKIPRESVDEKLRRQAKTINFGIIYGMSAYRLATELSTSNMMAQEYIDNYFERYIGVKNFIKEVVDVAATTKQVTTLLGRKRQLKDICSPNHMLQKLAKRASLNTVIQGTAADLMKVAMINVDSALSKAKLETAMLLSVHDEIVLEVPFKELDQVKDIVRNTMESVFRLLVPLKINLVHGKNWAEAH